MNLLPDLLTPGMTERERVAWWWSGELAIRRRKRLESLAMAHERGRHLRRRSPECRGCGVVANLDTRERVRLLTEPFCAAFSPPPIPKGFTQ